MCWYQRNSKSSLRKPFGFSIPWSCNSVPSDFHNHQIRSENLNPSSSTNPLEANQFREISMEVNEPFSSCIVYVKSWRHWQKIPFCFRKDKRKGQSSQIFTRNHSSVAEETPTASKQRPNRSQWQAVKAEEEDLNIPKTFGRIHFYSLACLQHKILFLGQLLQLPPVAIQGASTASQLLVFSIIPSWTIHCSPKGLVGSGQGSSSHLRATSLLLRARAFGAILCPSSQCQGMIPGILVFSCRHSLNICITLGVPFTARRKKQALSGCDIRAVADIRIRGNASWSACIFPLTIKTL